ncbi:MAG: DNA methyltransferase [Desulfatiglandales bacterium]
MKPELKTVKLSDIIFDQVLYPRDDHDPALAQKYSESIENIEAKGRFISVDSENNLLDGKHRWLGYRTAYEDDPTRDIKVFVYSITEEREKFALACELNNDFGLQLSLKSKKIDAIRLYGYGYPYDFIAGKLSVGKAKIVDWLSRTVKEQKDQQNTKIMAMWLACHTQQEIAEVVGLSREAIDKILNGREDEPGLVQKFQENQSTKLNFLDWTEDKDIPLYNIWKQQNKSSKIKYPGNTEEHWVENLLYLYTQPLDIVVDPFAGGGSTIDVCKHRGRRYFVSDRKPIKVRETEIRQIDIVDGLPPVPRWKDVRLVYLDPPYWWQSKEKYSKDPTDLGNMELEEFNKTLSGLICGFAKKLHPGSFIALIIQPTQWNAPEHQYTDHVADILRLVKLPIEMRISAPYESQQNNAQMVAWAKENRKLLVLSREIVVWRVD